MVADNTADLQIALDNAANNQVSHMLAIAIDRASCDYTVETAANHANIYASVGIHPNVDPIPEETLTVEQLTTLANQDKVIAIGETGLDYFRSEGDLSWQRERFNIHIEAAKQTQKPLIIHTREARDDTMDMLEQEGAEQAGGIIHCFTEDWDTAKRALDIGFYISLSGIVSFKNALQLQDVAKKLPADRILIETDSPYLAPVPHRGKANQPAFVKHVAEAVAALRNETVDTIAQQTTANFHRLFPTTA